MHTKSGQNGSKPGQNSCYVRNWLHRTYFCTILMPEGQLWPFLRIPNSKLGKNIAKANLAKTWSICQNLKKTVMYNFANKMVVRYHHYMLSRMLLHFFPRISNLLVTKSQIKSQIFTFGIKVGIFCLLIFHNIKNNNTIGAQWVSDHS